MSVVVLGAGVVGIQTAYALARRGTKVTVIERGSAPANLCSKGNAGIISIGHAEAWAGPGALGTMIRAAAGRDPGVKVSRWSDPALIRWGLEFLRNCSAEAHGANSDRLARLCRFSRARLPVVAEEAGLAALVRHAGGFYLHTDRAEFETFRDSHASAHLQPVTAAEIVAKDPRLSRMTDHFAGGFYAPEDSVGDCHLFTNELGAHLGRLNHVTLRYDTEFEGFERQNGTITGIRAGGEVIAADHVILATGIETPDLTRPLGFAPNIYPVKGYSGSWRIKDAEAAPTLPFIDEAARLAVGVYSGILRITALAEFAGRNRDMPEKRLDILRRYAERHFADVVDLDDGTFWTGLRPTTPASAPYLGRVRAYPNLWINAGHGSLGWTASAGCGELLAQAISGEAREVQDVSAQARWLDPL